MFKPTATYRLQLHKDFTFKHVEQLIPYFKKLGVSTLYASPIFKAIPGSSHGYDGVEPHKINEEIGSESELVHLTTKLKKNGISWIQDIVPNHMSFHPDNIWLMDVLEKWDQSEYFDFFDINFETKLDDKRLMVPFLGESLEDAIKNRTLKVVTKNSKFYFNYGDSEWPLNAQSYKLFINQGEELSKTSKKSTEKEIDDSLAQLNNDSKLLLKVAYAQYYRLCHWQETEQQINYRRFFTVNSLICMKMERPQVFDAFHKYILELVKKEVFQGLRIDHVDGLADPTGYLERLRKAVGPETYIVVEKILAAEETLPSNWPVEGNTGYDFLAMVNNLFTNRAAEASFTDIYQELTKKGLTIDEQIAQKKKAILFDHMHGELEHLVEFFSSLNLTPQKTSDKLDRESLKNAIADFLIYCPVYRFYGSKFPLEEDELAAVRQIIESIPKHETKETALEHLGNLFSSKDKDLQKRINTFYMRCMQFSGPLMAKGVEDTLMYTYNRFVGHTEVGDSPEFFGLSIAKFHELMVKRLANFPLSMNATATHDTKRGEDVRARLNVLTDIPNHWKKLIKKLKATIASTDDVDFLHRNDAYLLYQAALGALPFVEEDDFENRFSNYVEKALREAKKRTTWAAPNQEYEQKAREFAYALLDQKGRVLPILKEFLKDIADYSILNSLSQLSLKFTCPGIPDLYQGTELWDLSLVDPDNRRPVDYELRNEYLTELEEDDLKTLWIDRKSGKLKLWLTKKLLRLRAEKPSLFETGIYTPVEVKGTYSRHIIAFLREQDDEYLLTVVPLGLAGIAKELDADLETFDWKDTEMLLPQNYPTNWESLLTNEKGSKELLKDGILISQLLNKFPLGLFKLSFAPRKRSSGVLMPVFSLPSKFGIGDFGQEAYKFIDFLAETNQKYWQLLPLNPTSPGDHESPYSSDSAMAGNVLFISLEKLVKQGWLEKSDLAHKSAIPSDKVDYRSARDLKPNLLKKAFKRFTEQADESHQSSLKAFYKLEEYWLKDYALFVVLRRHHKDKDWNNWPEEYRLRDPKALADYSERYSSEIQEIYWQQFIFHKQWMALRSYAKAKRVQFIGDLPFYVAYNSADVWSNPNSFKLDKKLEMIVVAGAPPDDLTKEGQRWGMPIFDWSYLKKHKYEWWMDRIKRNIELFDVVRIDHYRAIHSYWEIPVEDTTAINGEWMEGPGASFLNEVCDKFHELPFVLEDLGGDMDGPAALRDEFNLTGMKILQFAFGGDFPNSEYLPHQYPNENCMVYVGTHDNNTAKGWYKEDLDEDARVRLSVFADLDVNKRNVHHVLMKMALSSTARIAILQMQDLLGLDASGRMNIPGTIKDNWIWRLPSRALNSKVKEWLLKYTRIYGR